MQKWLKYKNEHHYSVLATFSGLGGSGWRLSGLSKHLGEKLGYLGRSWRQVGTLWQHVGIKMAKKSEDCELGAKLGG